MIVRRVDVSDPEHAHDFLAMQEACFPGDYVMAPMMEDTLAWWFAFDHGDPVAFACLAQGSIDPSMSFLAWAGVMPEARGCGLQKRLIKVRVAEAVKRGYSACLTYTTTGNPWSSNNLIASGFRLYDSKTEWAGKGRDDVLYWRRQLRL